MKTLQHCFILFITVVACWADETSTLYVNDDESIYYDGKGHIRINPQKIEAAKTNRESLPSLAFPEGNWGQMDHGCQLSLRLDRQTYTNKDPITTMVLVRNATNNQDYLVMFHHSNKTTGWSINYSVSTESNPDTGMKPSRAEPRIFEPTSFGFNVHSHTQRKFSDRLSDMFDLTNGVYFVQASVTGYAQRIDTNRHSSFSGIEMPKPLGNLECFELKSAKVRIEIK